MRYIRSEDEEFFRSTTARFLTEFAPPARLRELRDDPVGFTPDYWRRGAELGWVSLLVGEEHGGGSISGSGPSDLTLVAHEFGAHGAPGPLGAANVVALALSAAGSHLDVLGEVMAGATIAAWCDGEQTFDLSSGSGVKVAYDGDDLVLSGMVRPVESAASATWLLVAGRSPDGPTQVLIPAATTGVTIAAMSGVDLTRRFAAVRLDGVRVSSSAVVGGAGLAGAALAGQRRAQRLVAAAESVGAMQTAFDMTVEWAFDRYSFGRPLASYQALKHRFADMKTWLEASHGIVDAAAGALTAAQGGADPDALREVDEVLHAALAYIGQNGSELLQDCVQLHGGLGVTFEHDVHIYLRRHTLNRSIHGAPSYHRLAIADIIEATEGRAA